MTSAVYVERMHSRWLAVVAVLISGATQADLVPPPTQCRHDSQCVVSRSGGCCGSCCPTTIAMSVEEQQRQQARCAVIDCARPVCTAKCAPPEPAANFRAVCRSGHCELSRVNPVKAECTVDADCELVTGVTAAEAQVCLNTACGCCPAAPRALTRAQAAREREARPAPKKTPPWGLSQGAAECPPCPPVPPARGAACESGRCTVR